jgi:hypothetical protein
MAVVLQEIIQDKIYLDPATNEVGTREEVPPVNVLDFEPSDE